MKAPTTLVSEEKLGYAMVKSRLLTEKKLQTALDFQRSLGGTLLEVVRRLGFIDPDVLNKFLVELNAAAGGGAEEPRKEPEKKPQKPGKAPPPPASRLAPAAPAAPAAPEPAGPDPVESELENSQERTQMAPGGEPLKKGDAAPAPGAVWERRLEDPVLGGLIRLLIAKGVIRGDELDATISV